MPLQYSAIVIGASAGGLTALSDLLSGIPKHFRLPIIVVQHRSKDERDLLEHVLQQKCEIRIKQADEKEAILGGFVYVAPPNYHLLVENNMSFSLSIDGTVNHSRPSIDVLFESAAQVYRDKLVGIIMTGSNDDGSNGIRSINRYQGLTIAQNPGEAQFPSMPVASIRTGAIKRILLLKEIQQFLISIANAEENEE